MSHFEEVKEEFLADIKAEVVMNEIPHDDQSAALLK